MSPSRKQYACSLCSYIGTRAFNRDRHFEQKHAAKSPVYQCSICAQNFSSIQNLKAHRVSHKPTTGFQLLRTAFTRSCVIYRKIYDEKMSTYTEAYTSGNSKFDSLKREKYLVNITLKNELWFIVLKSNKKLTQIKIFF